MNFVKTIYKNLYSTVSSLWVVTNLTICVLLLIPVAVLRLLLPFNSVRHLTFVVMDFLYRAAVYGNSFWMQKVVGIELVVTGEIGRHPSPIIICNHQSWFDIPVLQEIITGRGPIIKFLVKKELIWVPIIGWICLAMNFPRLNRGSGRDARRSDYSTIQSISMSLDDEPGALLIFPEGTRFTEQKKIRQESPYQHLLKPKTGGMRIIKDAASSNTPVIDITISYDRGVNNFWQCLHGEIKKIYITIDHFTMGEIDDPKHWLEERWSMKERIITRAMTLAESRPDG